MIEAGRFARFLLVGASNAAVSYVAFLLCLMVLPGGSLAAFAAQAVSYGCGIAWSYFWNRRWSFRSRDPVGRQAARFVATQLTFLLGSAAGVALLVHSGLTGPRLSWLLVMTVVTVLNYAVLAHWVFAPGAPARR